MRDADDPHIIAVCSLQRWDDCHTLPNLRQSKQGVRCATLEQNVGFDIGETASGVEQPPNGIAIQQQQRIGGKAPDIYLTRMAEFEGCGSDGQCLGWRQDATLEAGIKAWIKPDAHMNFAAFEHGRLFWTERFTELDMHVGKPLSILG